MSREGKEKGHLDSRSCKIITISDKKTEGEQDATKAREFIWREGRMKISTRENNQPSSARTIQDCILT